MYAVHAFVFAILSCSIVNAVSFHQLTSGSPFQTNVLPYYSFPNDTQGLAYDYYAIFVPANVLSVQLSLQFDNSTCPLQLAVRVLGLPCPDISPFDSVSGICNLDSQIVNTPITLFAAFPGPIEFLTGKNWYLGVGKVSVASNALSCPYTITAIVTTCAANQVDSFGNGDAQDCIGVVTLNETATGYSFNSNSSFYAINITVPDHVGQIDISVLSQTQQIELIAGSWTTPVYAGALSFYGATRTNITDAQGNFQGYNYALTVKTPRAGPLTLLVVNTYAISKDMPAAFSATVNFGVLACDTGKGGLTCSNVLALFAPTTYSIPANSWLYLEYDYTSINQNPSGFETISLDLVPGSQVLVLLKREAFPIDLLHLGYDSKAYTVTISPNTDTITNGFQLVAQDFAEVSKYYVGFYGITAATFTLNTNSTISTTSGGSGSTAGVANIAANLGAQSTGGPTLTLGFPGQASTSAAAFLVPSLQSAITMLSILLFAYVL